MNKETYCAKCLRTSKVVDMSNCPFCSDINRGNLLITSIEKAYPEAYRLARRFHELYEITAPAFGYKTKEETKEFDPVSANGRLMAWVCFEVVKEELQREIGDMFLCKSCRKKNGDRLDKLELF